MHLNSNIGQNLKQLREKRKLSLDAAATLTGVSRSMIAQIEKGDANPTISILWKIANGFKISFSSLVEPTDVPTSVIHEKDITPLIEDDGKYINHPIFPFDDKKLFETYKISIKPEGQLAAQAHLLGTEEYLTVFLGTLEVRVDDKHYILSKGDSIRFKADVPHAYKNIGQDTVEFNMIIYYNA